MKSGLIYIISLICFLLLFILVYFRMDNDVISGTFLNTDTLYQPSIYIDIVEQGNGFSKWHLNPAPNFFPDTPLYFLLMWMTGGSAIWSTFLFSIIQLILIQLLVLGILNHFKPSHKYYFGTVSNLFLASFALSSLISKDFLFTFYLLSNSYHLGSFVMTLIGFNLYFSILKNATFGKYIWLGLICFLGFPSDKLFLISFIFPLSLTALIRWNEFILRRIHLKIILSLFLGTIIGSATIEILQLKGLIFIEQPHSFLAFDNIIGSLNELFRQYWNYLRILNFVSLIFLLSFISLVLGVIRILRLYFSGLKSQSFELGLIYLSIIFIIIAPVLTGNYTGKDTIRYNYHAYVLLIIFLPLVKFDTFKISDKSLKLIAQISMWVLISTLGFESFNVTFKPSNYFSYYPKIAEATDEFAKQTGNNCGTAPYWQAKTITLFSKQGVLVVPTFDHLVPYDHATTKDIFSRHPVDKTPPLLTFSIIDCPERRNTLENLFNTSELRTLNIDGFEFIIHPAYTYERDTYTIYKQ